MTDMPFTIGGDYIPNQENPKKKTQPVKVRKEKRKKSFVTLVLNLNLNAVELKNLAKELKQSLACGGCIKDSVIELQGDKVDATKKILLKKGIKNS